MFDVGLQQSRNFNYSLIIPLRLSERNFEINSQTIFLHKFIKLKARLKFRRVLESRLNTEAI